MAIVDMNMKADAMKNTARQPKYSPTRPLNTREANIPVSNPEIMMPMFLPLSLGMEY
jgi:hypothetical protein